MLAVQSWSYSPASLPNTNPFKAPVLFIGSLKVMSKPSCVRSIPVTNGYMTLPVKEFIRRVEMICKPSASSFVASVAGITLIFSNSISDA